MKRWLVIGVMVSVIIAVLLGCFLPDHSGSYLFRPRSNPWIWVKSGFLAYAFGTGSVMYCVPEDRFWERRLAGVWIGCLVGSFLVWMGPLAFAFWFRRDYDRCFTLSLFAFYGPTLFYEPARIFAVLKR